MIKKLLTLSASVSSLAYVVGGTRFLLLTLLLNLGVLPFTSLVYATPLGIATVTCEYNDKGYEGTAYELKYLYVPKDNNIFEEKILFMPQSFYYPYRDFQLGASSFDPRFIFLRRVSAGNSLLGDPLLTASRKRFGVNLDNHSRSRGIFKEGNSPYEVVELGDGGRERHEHSHLPLYQLNRQRVFTKSNGPFDFIHQFKDGSTSGKRRETTYKSFCSDKSNEENISLFLTEGDRFTESVGSIYDDYLVPSVMQNICVSCKTVLKGNLDATKLVDIVDRVHQKYDFKIPPPPLTLDSNWRPREKFYLNFITEYKNNNSVMYNQIVSDYFLEFEKEVDKVLSQEEH